MKKQYKLRSECCQAHFFWFMGKRFCQKCEKECEPIKVFHRLKNYRDLTKGLKVG